MSNSSIINKNVDICSYHGGYIANGGKATLECSPSTVGRYVSVINGKPSEHYWFAICEAVVIGYKVAGKTDITRFPK